MIAQLPSHALLEFSLMLRSADRVSIRKMFVQEGTNEVAPVPAEPPPRVKDIFMRFAVGTETVCVVRKCWISMFRVVACIWYQLG
jgi:hypothetical protein